MNAKRLRRIADLVTPSLRTGERIIVVGKASIASAPTGPDHPAPVHTASAATVGYPKPRVFYLAVTDERLLVLARSSLLRRPTARLAGQIARDGIVAMRADPRRITFDLAVAGRAKGLRVRFARGHHAAGTTFAHAIGCVPADPVPVAARTGIRTDRAPVEVTTDDVAPTELRRSGIVAAA